MYLEGQGAPPDAAKALANFERSCAGHWGESCAAAAILYQRGAAGPPNVELAQKRFEEGCELGYQPACRYVDGPGFVDPVLR
jgi:TPR repeat protein